MIMKLRSRLNNEKGMTLIELLAVIVILGIIAAIAIPSISGIIDNSKKDAHIANAQTLVAAAKLGVAAGTYVPGSAECTAGITAATLNTDGYLEATIEDPDGGTYDLASSKVVITIDTDDDILYTVTLVGNERQISAEPSTGLDRTDVKDVP